MPRPWRIRYAGAKYHVTSRGNGREAIFLGEQDCERFLEQLDSAVDQDNVILYAYVLMPNHFHLLIETPRGNIQKFMQRINTAYSMYFRYKHSRPGHCFQGRYGAKLVSDDEYIMRVTRYIHLNPVKVKRRSRYSVEQNMAYLNKYRWSSYPGYAGLMDPEERVDYKWLYLTGRKTLKGRRRAYREYVESMAGKEDKIFTEADRASRYAIGDEEFREMAKDELRSKRMERAVTGDIIWPEDEMLSLEQVEQVVLSEFKISKEQIRGHARHMGGIKAAAVELCCQFTGQSNRAIGKYFGYASDSAVGQQRKALAERLRTDKRLAKQIDTSRKRLRSC